MGGGRRGEGREWERGIGERLKIFEGKERKGKRVQCGSEYVIIIITLIIIM